MKVLSLFDGISCGMVALERTNIPVERYVAYEIDKYAIKVSKNNYPLIEHCGDVATADFAQYKGFDLLIGGSPCTYWSIAKKDRETTCDGIGFELFMNFKRALVESGCKYFLYENNNSIHKDIKEEISKQLGVEPIIINSALVSAQQRKRCYWTNIPNVTQPKDKGKFIKDILENEPVNISHYVKENLGIRYALKNIKSNTDKAVTCTATMYKGFGNDGTTLVAIPITIEDISNEPKYKRIYRAIDGTISLSINGKRQIAKIDLPNGYYVMRKLTPLEAERLQTLPDDYTQVISNTQRYKCIGNGWTVDVISHILKGLKDEM